MSQRLSLEHRIKVVELFFESGKSVITTQRRYCSHFGVRDAPAANTIKAIVKRFQESGSVQDAERSGRPTSVRDADNVERVMRSVRSEPSTSIRRRSQELDIKKSSLQKILTTDLNLFPYKIQIVQELKPTDYETRLTFCAAFLTQSDLTEKLIMTDEAHFNLSGFINKQNYRFWGTQQPQVMIEKPLHPERVSVWCGLSSQRIYGPYFFDGSIDGNAYRHMLVDWFFPQVDNAELWFQQDGATPHTAREILELLRGKFPNRLISRFGTINWPARSPDLSAPDYWLWGYLKDRVYTPKPRNIHMLRMSIEREIAIIIQDMLFNVMNNLKERTEQCRTNGGGHLKDVIFHK